MKALLTFLLLTIYCSAYSQLPPIVFGATERNIKDSLQKLDFKLESKTYSETGIPILMFTSDGSNLKTSIVYAIFKLGIEGKCSDCYYFYNNSKDLDVIVDFLNLNSNFKKKDNSFGWESKKFNYDINIIHETGKELFTLQYTWLRDERK